MAHKLNVILIGVLLALGAAVPVVVALTPTTPAQPAVMRIADEPTPTPTPHLQGGQGGGGCGSGSCGG